MTLSFVSSIVYLLAIASHRRHPEKNIVPGGHFVFGNGHQANRLPQNGNQSVLDQQWFYSKTEPVRIMSLVNQCDQFGTANSRVTISRCGSDAET
jgi:hypothetical protein